MLRTLVAKDRLPEEVIVSSFHGMTFAGCSARAWISRLTCSRWKLMLPASDVPNVRAGNEPVVSSVEKRANPHSAPILLIASRRLVGVAMLYSSIAAVAISVLLSVGLTTWMAKISPPRMTSGPMPELVNSAKPAAGHT